MDHLLTRRITDTMRMLLKCMLMLVTMHMLKKHMTTTVTMRMLLKCMLMLVTMHMPRKRMTTTMRMLRVRTMHMGQRLTTHMLNTRITNSKIDHGVPFMWLRYSF
jgi:hypothetical protein